MKQISIVLVGSESSGNVGAIARLCANFGVKELILIKPECVIDGEAYARAVHGKKYLDESPIYPSLKDIVEKFDLLIGFSARDANDNSNVLRIPISLDVIPNKMKNVKGSIGLVFGRESSGLTNKELNICDFLTQIVLPTKPNYPVLNLSHAVCVALYTLTRDEKKNEEQCPKEEIRELNGVELRMLHTFFEESVDMLFPDDERRRGQVKRVFQNIMGRSFVSGREAHTLLGTFRLISKYLAPPYKEDRTYNEEE
ncbi:MAG: TrmJ/YjtD family RNA methyltransferase [Candidatus Heimdallarchaeota archaeon]|nr:TrmJ/YjtD family RNA methyltransferase [Candidatus Heimdallarchaeota archaeon]MCK5048812.1 TrmJ/YjtD family RNA methyltransferase [Candidatus Heimdallarchaeota archaeon]